MRTICQAAPFPNGGRVGHLEHLQLWNVILCYVRVNTVKEEKIKNFQTCFRTSRDENVARQCSHVVVSEDEAAG